MSARAIWPRLVLGLALAAVFAAPSTAPAKTRTIDGKLSKRGYTVISLSARGQAQTDLARRGKFQLRPLTERVTLHLRERDGTYGGPIVVGREEGGDRAIVGIREGAKLGRVKVKAARGYARPAGGLAERWVDFERTARARNGVPIGVGRFGRVRVRRLKGPRGDRDHDGIPDALDIDDDGDLVLDDVDRSAAARQVAGSKARGAQTPPELFDVGTALSLPLYDTANANAPGSTDAQIEAAMPTFGILGMEVLPGDTAELDCGGSPNPSPPPALVGGLVYCSTGGTGRAVISPNPPVGTPFPDEFDGDGDGFGALAPQPDAPGPVFGLLHGATTAQIRTGDVLIQRVTTAGVETQFPTSLQYVLSTVPALATYADEAGNAAAVPYPIAGPGDPGAPGPGTHGNGFPVADGPDPDDDVEMTLAFWRPQRRPIPGEPGFGTPGAWIDIGGLNYGAVAQAFFTPEEVQPIEEACPASAFATVDPNLATAVPPPEGVFTDLAVDQPANPANTFAYTLNVTRCLASLGLAWEEGRELDLTFAGANAGGRADQGVTFERQPGPG